MQRSLFTAISGLNNHQTKLDVIGNNIANVNTTAFKSGRVRFADILNQTLRGASAPQDNRGGINPMQVGLGMQLAAIDNNHTQGNLQSTGRELDMAIQGNGFFIVSDGRQKYFTRDGSFARGADGFLVNSANGFQVMGWMAGADGSTDITQPPGSLNIPLGFKAEARATAQMIFGGNLNASVQPLSGGAFPLEMDIYDSLGNVHTLEIEFEKTEVNLWTWQAYLKDGDAFIGSGSGSIIFNEQGSVASGQQGTFTLNPIPGGSSLEGSEPLKILLDFSALSQLVGETDALLRRQDGFPMGILNAFNMDSTGIIAGAYSNGMVVSLGQIALGRFENPEGLIKVGANMFQSSANSGDVFIGAPGTQGRGKIETSTLEMSNVNIAFEFTEIITTSRAFQANSRVITSSDELLQEVVNLKR
ncbi:MAG: flagellar hook protein FlgE [Dethiobacter sp.]|jgi:flagellar hook protein FlgE|nr:MAG: flagellar hook protein FlgE [Dethiobacter sp.]